MQRIAGESPRVTIILDTTIRSPVPGFSRCFRGPRREEVLENLMMLEGCSENEIYWPNISDSVRKDDIGFYRLFPEAVVYRDNTPYDFYLEFREARSEDVHIRDIIRFCQDSPESWPSGWKETAEYEEVKAYLYNDCFIGPCRPGYIKDVPLTDLYCEFDMSGQSHGDIQTLQNSRYYQIPLDEIEEQLKNNPSKEFIDWVTESGFISDVILEKISSLDIISSNDSRYMKKVLDYTYEQGISNVCIHTDIYPVIEKKYMNNIKVAHDMCNLTHIPGNTFLEIIDMNKDKDDVNWREVMNILMYEGCTDYLKKYKHKISYPICRNVHHNVYVDTNRSAVEYILTSGILREVVITYKRDCPEKTRLAAQIIAEKNDSVEIFLSNPRKFAYDLADYRPYIGKSHCY